MKCASDGGESNPVEVADDFSPFWDFAPEQQEKRSVGTLLPDMYIITNKYPVTKSWWCNHFVCSEVTAASEVYVKL
jgi:hypothetical protein